MWDWFSDLMFDLNLMFLKELVSAVVGAVVGGALRSSVRSLASRDARAVREADRLLARQALANSLLFKMIRIYSNVSQINRHIEECFERAARAQLSWRAMAICSSPRHTRRIA